MPSQARECCDQFGVKSKLVRQNSQSFSIHIHSNNVTNNLSIQRVGVVKGEHTGLNVNDFDARFEREDESNFVEI